MRAGIFVLQAARSAEKRSDLGLYGVDITDKRCTGYASATYRDVTFTVADLLLWRSTVLFDVVVCTGALHHIAYDRQEAADHHNIASMVSDAGLAIISDCYLDDYSNEQERKLAAAKLDYEYLRETIENGSACSRSIDGTIDILRDDVLGKEFKISLQKRLPLLEKYFHEVRTLKKWPTIGSEYGDYIHICRRV